jgi:NitT/TauT family transport system substrate-binding protein
MSRFIVGYSVLEEKKMKSLRWIVLLVVVLALVACGGQEPAGEETEEGANNGAVTETDAPANAEVAEETPDAGTEEEQAGGGEEGCAEMTPVRLQLQWVAQSQFAGYYAAQENGFYADECLEVTILEGAVEIVPQQVVAAGDAEFGIAWVPKMLASREQGADLVNIGQVFQRSGTLQIAWADSGITTVEDWAGKRVGTWGFGNEWEVFAALRQAGIDPDDPAQVTIVQQPFDMSLLLNREIDVAQAEIYNEYAQLLEATNPDTGELYQPEDFTVFDYNEVGTAMLQDHIFVRESWLAEEGSEEIATRFLEASFRGWIWCRDNFDACVQIVLDAGPTLGEGHMRWMLNEINALIWPSPQGIGVMDPALYEQTVNIALDFGVIQNQPDEAALRTDLAEAALAEIGDLDTTGSGFAKQEVEVTAGGE